MTTHIGATDDTGRPLRADAERNRRRIIAAAHELFAERGLDVSLDDVAAAAGVGVGTVYRRFANRDELIIGVFAAHLEEVEEQTKALLDDAGTDPWVAVVTLATTVCEAMAEDRGLTAIMMQIDHNDPTIHAVKARLTTRLQEVFRRAREAGVIRRDIESNDLYAIFSMVSGFAAQSEPVAPGAWRRYLELLLDALRTDGAITSFTVPALTDEQILAVQKCQRAERRRDG